MQDMPSRRLLLKYEVSRRNKITQEVAQRNREYYTMTVKYVKRIDSHRSATDNRLQSCLNGKITVTNMEEFEESSGCRSLFNRGLLDLAVIISGLDRRGSCSGFRVACDFYLFECCRVSITYTYLPSSALLVLPGVKHCMRLLSHTSLGSTGCAFLKPPNPPR